MFEKRGDFENHIEYWNETILERCRLLLPFVDYCHHIVHDCELIAQSGVVDKTIFMSWQL
ncbi:MAG: hypothetical protein IMW92_02405 [Bacillales bacterium]|nr:hypothetical protein [Bacillales bacterium]